MGTSYSDRSVLASRHRLLLRQMVEARSPGLVEGVRWSQSVHQQPRSFFGQRLIPPSVRQQTYRAVSHDHGGWIPPPSLQFQHVDVFLPVVDAGDAG